jgi:plastocyanin
MRPITIASLAAALAALGCSAALAATQPRSAHRPKACAHRAYRLHHPRRCHVAKRKSAPLPAKPPPAASPAAGSAAALVAIPAFAAPAPAAPQPSPQPQPKEEAPTVTTPEGEAEPPSVPHVQVSAVEWDFKLSRSTVPAGKVVLEFVNAGQDEHNLNLQEASEGPSEEPVANTPAKGVVDVTLQMRPGSYTLFCSLPTHEQKGMKATLTVE